MNYLQKYTLWDFIHLERLDVENLKVVSAYYLQSCLEYCHATKGTHTEPCIVPRGSIKSL